MRKKIVKEYGHKLEYGRDGKPTGRTISYIRDRTSKKIIDTIIHTHFLPSGTRRV
uniref:Uncharacterized protein n=1 Tax=viral metagenome TaxID=1070528 RepID=A0A6M3LGT8_9ZZZZ